MSKENEFERPAQNESDEYYEKELEITSAATNIKVVGERVAHTFNTTSGRKGEEYTQMRLDKIRELDEAVKKLKESLGVE